MTAFDISSLAEFAVALKSGVVDEALRKPTSNEKLISIIEKTFLHNNH
jgi:FixJ family two-component response regulator